LQLLEKIILEGQEKNLFKKTVDPEIAERIIFGAIDELALVWILMKKKRFELDAAAVQLFQLIYDGIKA
jgi:TetR/AcrR family fatty acid metabolism transcriptional regulator